MCFEVFFIPLSILALLLIVWALFMPVAIPTPPFRSKFLTALKRSNAMLRTRQRDNIIADAEVLARFLPNRLTITEAEIVPQRECAKCPLMTQTGYSPSGPYGSAIEVSVKLA